ncbi:putative Ty-3/Gypsy retrotransposon polyprotein, partial [Trifolium medium]|nr:putative Ty-3/Gypsy retrotransposon polyprotein [Trifolium medium]
MDFITNLPVSHGKTVIWVVVDRLTKSAHFIGHPTSFLAASFAPIFLSEIYRLHGMPKSIVSDRDRVFTSKFWRELFKLNGTTLAFSSAYHPKSDGQTEVVNRILQTYLHCFACHSPKRWFQYLHLAEFWYNSSYQSSLRMLPFEALYGRSPPSITSYIQGFTQIASFEDSLTQRDQLLGVIRTNLSKAQTRMKSLANVHRLDRIFKVGDYVLLKLQPYRQTSVTGQPPPKLARRFVGPFRILRRIGEVAYELDLPPGSRIHPVFHIYKLKPF